MKNINMKIQLISIGNELLNGKILDKNAHWMAKFCFAHNIELQRVQIVGDNEADFKNALANALDSADVVLTSGGLGPTRDDITKRMLAEYFDKTILPNSKAWEITQNHYDRYGRELIKENLDYGNIPQDFVAFHNPVGFAPGLGYVENGKVIASMPGVPSEFQSMFSEVIFPFIQKQFTQDHSTRASNYFKHVIIKTSKLHESKIFTEVCPGLWEKLEAYGEISSLPHVAGVDIGVKLVEDSNESIEKKEKEILDMVFESSLKEYIWHIGPESIEEVIIQTAKEKNITIGFAESCTGGLCADRITSVAGSSRVFWGSIVSYANEVKMKSLKVNETTLLDFGAVSKETALEMAIGAREQLGVDITVSTTGIAGPGGGSKEKPVGTVGIGFSHKDQSDSKIYHFNGNRESLKYSFSQVALFTLLSQIKKL